MADTISNLDAYLSSGNRWYTVWDVYILLFIGHAKAVQVGSKYGKQELAVQQ